MQEKLSVKTIIRWILVPLASYSMTYVGGALVLFAMLIGFIPLSGSTETIDIVSAVINGFGAVLAVLIGASLAPSYKARTAVVLALGIPFLSLVISREIQFHAVTNLIEAIVGGLVTALIVWLWVRPGHSTNTRKYIVALCAVSIILSGGLLFARFLDYPAYPDPLPNYYGLEKFDIAQFYSYRLAGFIDETYFWRFQTNETTIQNIAAAFSLEKVDNIPSDFLYYRPFWWPKRVPDHFLAFKSQEFSFTTRPGDGTYYFLVYDQDLQRAFVWVDANF